jgi:hypothetical protein
MQTQTEANEIILNTTKEDVTKPSICINKVTEGITVVSYNVRIVCYNLNLISIRLHLLLLLIYAQRPQ